MHSVVVGSVVVGSLMVDSVVVRNMIGGLKARELANVLGDLVDLVQGRARRLLIARRHGIKLVRVRVHLLAREAVDETELAQRLHHRLLDDRAHRVLAHRLGRGRLRVEHGFVRGSLEDGGGRMRGRITRPLENEVVRNSVLTKFHGNIEPKYLSILDQNICFVFQWEMNDDQHIHIRCVS